MHMADALLSPTVGLLAWGGAAAMLAVSARRIREETANDEKLVPLMGVLGAFVFAAQMINFAIPGTGSSGHIGGGLLLAILLGPSAAFMVIASVLTVQALLFADGGLLALGANLINLGALPCFVAYPLVFKLVAGSQPSDKRLALACVLSAVFGLQLGAFGVVLETVFSGISSLPFQSFVALMQPIHLAIGLIEGVATAALVLMIRRARPDLVGFAAQTPARISLRQVMLALLLATGLTAGVLSTYASAEPDGLEWSIERVAGSAILHEPSVLHETLAQLQTAVALLPDYELPRATAAADATPAAAGASLAGLVGGSGTLFVVALIGWVLRRRVKAA